MKNIFLVLIISVFLISLISAPVTNLGTFKQYECIELPQSCITCTYNNISRISVERTNQSILSQETPMTKNGILYNYTFCDTSVLGEYLVEGHGDLDGTDTIWSYGFKITSTGKLSNITIPIFLLIFSVVLLVLGIVIKNPAIGFFSGVLFVMVGMYLMIYGFGDIVDLYTQAFALIILGFGILTTILAGYSWLEDY